MTHAKLQLLYNTRHISCCEILLQEYVLLRASYSPEEAHTTVPVLVCVHSVHTKFSSILSRCLLNMRSHLMTWSECLGKSAPRLIVSQVLVLTAGHTRPCIPTHGGTKSEQKWKQNALLSSSNDEVRHPRALYYEAQRCHPGNKAKLFWNMAIWRGRARHYYV